MDYTPRIFHAVFTALLCIICLLLGTRFPRYSFAFDLGAFIFSIILVIVLILLVMDGRRIVIDSMTDFAVAFGKLDDEGRAAMAFQFPTMRYEMKRGRVRAMFESTNVPIDMFKDFLLDSSAGQVSPERNWQTAERPAWAWLEIYTHLADKQLIVADSAAGSHSHRWVGNAYQHLCAYWLAGRSIPNLSEMETA